MSDWIAIILLVLFGLILIITEIIFVPGTTIVGIIGFAFTVGGIIVSFAQFGNFTGWMVTLAAALVGAIATYYSFKTKAWRRFGLKSIIDSKVNIVNEELKAGDEGIALSTLRPIGKALFGNFECEVRSNGAYVPTGKKLKIIKIEINKIFVEPIN